MDFQSAFKKPFTDVKKLIIGILLSIVPIVNFFATGFMMETAKMEMKKKKMLPEWAAWGDLFVKGLLAFVISILYALPMIIIGAYVAWPLLKSAIGTGVVPMAMWGGLSGGIAVVLLLGLLVAYIAPSALLHFVKDGKFGAAFQFGSVFKKAFKKEYFLAWIVAMLYSLVLGSILSYIPVIGSAASGFIAGVTMFSLLGEVFPKL
ncbi:MAG: DUF4013 domain-containing protein [Nanoarchaeota archaeon]|nr:DUF4013 domain-containing protein [Nanoarchaeota archaeon]MBU4352772.1 DUF4013 domain-containing protein [Nanoarchaeota archaeon]MBU4456829.1 DUF4013 domain-containing protein [Nanoarchaeota archaeon]MCG2719690.1 DUF4013 domain-containing protein [Nanoarchaeota archaeon]